MRKKDSNLFSFSSLAGISIIEKVLSFVFQALIAAVLGANLITDSYYSASELFILVDKTLLDGLTIVMINRYANHVNSDGEEAGFTFLSDMQSFLSPIMLLISFAFFAFSEQLSYVVAPGYGIDARMMLIRCIKMMAIVPFFLSFTCIGRAVLRQKKRFGITALHSLTVSLSGILCVLLLGRKAQNADALSLSYVLSALSFMLIVRITMRKYGKITLHKPKLTDEIKLSLRLVVPLMVSTGISRLSLLVDRIIASNLGEGTVSSLSYTHTLYNLVTNLLIVNLCTILLTDFNNLYAQNKTKEMCRKMENAVSAILLVLVPVTIITIICHEDIVRTVFERGMFSKKNTAEVAMLLSFYAGAFIPRLITSVCNQALYAFGDTKAVMNRSIVNISLNIVISIILSRLIGIKGVVIGTLVSGIVASILSIVSVRKHFPNYKVVNGDGYLIKTITASLICFIAVFLIKVYLKFDSIVVFSLATIVGFAVFLITLLLMKEKIALTYFHKIQHLCRRRKK